MAVLFLNPNLKSQNDGGDRVQDLIVFPNSAHSSPYFRSTGGFLYARGRTFSSMYE